MNLMCDEKRGIRTIKRKRLLVEPSYSSLEVFSWLLKMLDRSSEHESIIRHLFELKILYPIHGARKDFDFDRGQVLRFFPELSHFCFWKPYYTGKLALKKFIIFQNFVVDVYDFGLVFYHQDDSFSHSHLLKTPCICYVTIKGNLIQFQDSMYLNQTYTMSENDIKVWPAVLKNIPTVLIN